MSGKIMVKKSLARILAASGLFAALERDRLREKAFVLMFHRVLGSKSLPGQYLQPGMYVTAESFEKQIAFLKKRYRLLFLEELIGRINRGDDIGGCCAITFDDGWRDNFSNAFPLLKKYQVPATIFLATSFVGTDRLFWPEEIANCLDMEPWSSDNWADACPGAKRFRDEIEKFKPGSRESFLNQAIEVLKTYPPGEREAVLDFCRSMRGELALPPQIMTWDEAMMMSGSGLVAFGAHTAGHEILDQLPAAEARREILSSREDIRGHLGVEAATFAYPNGNYNETVKNILQEGGFAGAVTTRKGLLSRDTHLLEIPRIAIHEDISDTVPMFQGRILLESF